MIYLRHLPMEMHIVHSQVRQCHARWLAKHDVCDYYSHSYRYCLHVWNVTAGNFYSISCRWSLLGCFFSISLSEVQSRRETQVCPHCYVAHCFAPATSSSSAAPRRGLCGGKLTNSHLLWTKHWYHILFIYSTNEHCPNCSYIHSHHHVLDNIQGEHIRFCTINEGLRSKVG